MISWSRTLTIFISIVGALVPATYSQTLHGSAVMENGIHKFIFSVHGPSANTTIPAEGRTSWREYGRGAPNTLAFLITDTSSNWLGIVRGLKSIGIPFCTMTSLDQALGHHVILSYPGFPIASNKTKIEKAVRSGKTILSIDPTRANQSLFGFTKAVQSKNRVSIHFLDTIAQAAHLSEVAERTIPFASPLDTTLDRWSTAYTPSNAEIAAEFEDGSCAMTMRNLGQGSVYALGIDLGYLLQIGYGSRQTQIARSYVNQFEPALDVPLRIIKSIYEAGEPNAVTLWPVPEGKSLTVLMTHDIDYDTSVRNAIVYANYERQNGIRATYFVQAKYITDYEDRAFIDDSAEIYLQELLRMGMEIGDHTVSHSHQFADYPMGTGSETYPEYTPFVKDRHHTQNGTILGELRASKFILETLTGVQLVSFRPGYLANPRQLPEALEATGFSYSSNVTANSVMTHLPFQLNYSYGFKQALPEYAFPITIEDRELPPMDQRIDSAIEVARKISRYGGCCCILIHPNELQIRWRFETGFVPAVKDWSWFGTVKDFGQFWRARDRTDIEVSDLNGGKEIDLTAPDEISGLTISVPSGWTFQRSEPAEANARMVSGRVVIGHTNALTKLYFSLQ